jgi:hypothetical protein
MNRHQHRCVILSEAKDLRLSFANFPTRELLAQVHGMRENGPS